MFLDFYNLREQPFGVSPNPAFLYLSHTHREALASLYYGIENERGFLALIARPGMGKTTILFQLLERLRNPCRMVFLFQTQCNSREFFRYLLSDLGHPAPDNDLVRMHLELNQILVREAKANRRFVLVVDEAQNLDNSVLETVRLLSDFETPRKKLMQIILSGQPELARKLLQPELSQLRQRLSIIGRLAPLTPPEVNEYINHRLKLAGWDGGTLFDEEARALIAVHSHGIPREVNNLCFNALSLGFAQRQKRIDRTILKEVVNDLDIQPLGSQSAPGAESRSIMKPVGPVANSVKAALGAGPQAAETSAASSVQMGSGRGTRRFPVAAMAAVLLLGILLLLLSLREKWSAWRQSELIPLPATGRLVTPAPGLMTPAETFPGSLLPAEQGMASAEIKEDPPLGLRPGEVLASVSHPGLQNPALLVQTRSTNPPPDLAGNVDKKTEQTAGSPGSGVVSVPDWDSVRPQDASPYLTVKVVRNQTLRRICLRQLGHYNPRLVEEIRALNPGLDDPDFILAGQRLLLPKPGIPGSSLQQTNSDESMATGR